VVSLLCSGGLVGGVGGVWGVFWLWGGVCGGGVLSKTTLTLTYRLGLGKKKLNAEEAISALSKEGRIQRGRGGAGSECRKEHFREKKKFWSSSILP